MKLSAFCMLLCSTSLTYARALVQGAVQPSLGNACSDLPHNGSFHQDCLDAGSHSISGFNATAVLNPKTVIPDLTSLGYKWSDMDEMSYFEYNKILIDVFSVSATVPNMIEVSIAFNRDHDFNPNKVPLRDILLSYWKYKKGRKIQDLEYLVYENVVEQDMRAMLPEIYNLLGRSMTEDKKDMTVVQVRSTASGDERVAYSKLQDGCPFPAGANKMLGEYAEFANRKLGNFELRWNGGDSFNFVVYFKQ